MPDRVRRKMRQSPLKLASFWTKGHHDMVFGETRLERIATGTLAAATVIVGASIIADGTPARLLNGISGLTWFASSAMFVIEGRRRGAGGLQWAGVVGLTAAVAFVIRPSDIVLATIGFGGAGALIAATVRKDPLLWAKLVPALYLPLHIGTAVLKAAGRSALGLESSIRTEPPPTTAVVPAIMLGTALLGAWAVSRRFGRWSRDGRTGRVGERGRHSM